MNLIANLPNKLTLFKKKLINYIKAINVKLLFYVSDKFPLIYVNIHLKFEISEIIMFNKYQNKDKDKT